LLTAKVAQITNLPGREKMAAYIIVDSNVHNPDRMKDYADKVRGTLAAYGGKPIVSAPDPEVIEGAWAPQRVVGWSSPTSRPRAWYDSPEYQEILPIRFEAANDKLLLVPGL
jgi:uncharacterized protein (DUF1330 family)